ncbi:MAG: hypothetical protein WAW88_14685, partial [Nocardioides sp.]
MPPASYAGHVGAQTGTHGFGIAGYVGVCWRHSAWHEPGSRAALGEASRREHNRGSAGLVALVGLGP